MALTILLVAAIGAFVFLSLNAKYHFACLFECKQHESFGPVVGEHGSPLTEKPSAAAVGYASTTHYGITGSEIHIDEVSNQNDPTRPTVTQTETAAVVEIEQEKMVHSKTPSTASTNFAEVNAEAKTPSNVRKTSPANRFPTVPRPTARRPRVHLKGQITVRGKIFFKGKSPKRFPRNSRLIVEFVDDRLADAPAVVLGKTTLDLSSYRRGNIMSYTITSKRPELPYISNSVSAVLNVGWKPRNKNDWIRQGDFFTDTHFGVKVNKFKRVYDRNIQLVKYY